MLLAYCCLGVKLLFVVPVSLCCKHNGMTEGLFTLHKLGNEIKLLLKFVY